MQLNMNLEQSSYRELRKIASENNIPQKQDGKDLNKSRLFSRLVEFFSSSPQSAAVTEKLEFSGNLGCVKREDSIATVFTTYVDRQPINWCFVDLLSRFCVDNNMKLNISIQRQGRQELDENTLTELVSFLASKGIKNALNESDLFINDNQLELRPSANIPWTALTPLAGLKTTTVTRYLIVPHARQELETTLSPSRDTRSLVMSTGCINSIQRGITRIQARLAFDYVLGAVVYNTKHPEYAIQFINFSNVSKDFYYYDQYYTTTGKCQVSAVDSIYLDDLHLVLADPQYLIKISRVIGHLQPTQVISGDVLDGVSINHHEAQRTGYFQTRCTLVDEIADAKLKIRLIMASANPFCKFVMLSSNHHDFFGKFIEKIDTNYLTKEDAILYHQTKAWLIENSRLDERGIKYQCPTKYWFKDCAVFEPVENHGIALGNHGHEYGMSIGALLNRSNIKVIRGHDHSPSIRRGIITVGDAMYERPHYQSEMSASLPALCVVYPNGKRSLLVNH